MAGQGEAGRGPVRAVDDRVERTAGAAPGREGSRKMSRRLLLARAEAILSDHDRAASERKVELVELLGQLSPEDFPAIGEVVRKFQGCDTLMEVAFVECWAELDPEAALEFSLPKGTGDAALGAWADRDLDAAVEWITEHRQAAGVDRVFGRLARIDSARAAELANAYPEAHWQYEACMGMLPLVFKEQGSAGLRERISEFQDPRMRCALMEKVCGWWPVEGDPEGLLEWLEAEPGNTADQLRGRFLQLIGKKHPALATGYFDELPAERRTREAFEGVIEGVGGFDPRAAVELIEQHPEFAGDGCARNLIRVAMLEEPEVVLAWVESQRDEAVRRSLRKEAVGFWLANRLDIARSWIEVHGTEEDRELSRKR